MDENLLQEFVVDYFKNIAIKLKALSHTENDPSFYFIKDMTDMGSVASAISTFREGAIMLLENHEGGIGSEGGDNDFEKIFGVFTVLIRATNQDEENELKDLYSRINAIALNIFTKLRKDKIEGELDYFTFEFNYHKVGPVADNRFGRRYEFSIGRALEIPFVEDNWIE